jgi:calcineurin-like phosphoesterase family protein
MRNIWFTSDTHFGHSRIIELCDRPFSSVDAMNEGIIENWNALVKPNDLVFHMGDVAMGKIADSLPLVGRLNGRIALVPGNHDRVFSGNKISHIERFTPEYLKVFETILPEWTGLDVLPVDFCHFPFAGDSHEDDRYTELRPVDNGQWLIHGHVHDEWKVRGKQINVGVDVWDFRPVHLDQIMEVIRNV